MSRLDWSSGKASVREFLDGRFIGDVLRPSCDIRVNIRTAFTRYLREAGSPLILAEENAANWDVSLKRCLEEKLADWEALGVPRPAEFGPDGNTIITWRHPKFQQVAGRKPLPGGFAEVSEWVRTHSEGQFLFVCACVLKLVGADPIFVTDASGDEGADLIGKLNQGPLRSVVFIVQSKTSGHPLTRDMVLAEYGKYLVLRYTQRFREYAHVLSLPQAQDGADFCYLIMTNGEFKPSARRVAAKLGILLRSGTQIAFWLSETTNRSKLESLERGLGRTLKVDLKNNLARRIIF